MIRLGQEDVVMCQVLGWSEAEELWVGLDLIVWW